MAQLGGRQPYTLVFRDYSGETKSIRLYTNEITGISLPDLLAELGTYKAAVAAVTLGQLAKEHWGEETIVSNQNAATKDAQVETELLVRCIGVTTQAPFSFRIPTVDYTKFNYGTGKAGDQVIIEAPGWSAETEALINAIQATFKMPDDETEALQVVGMEVVR